MWLLLFSDNSVLAVDLTSPEVVDLTSPNIVSSVRSISGLGVSLTNNLTLKEG